LRGSGGRAEAAQQPLLLGLQLHKDRLRPRPDDDGARLVAAKGGKFVKRDRERRAANGVERMGHVVGDALVHVADEAQGDVVVFGVDPARAIEAAAQASEALGHGRRNFEGREQSGHVLLHSVSPRYCGLAAPARF